MSLIEEQSKRNSLTSKKVWVIAKREKKDSFSLLQLVSDRISQMISELEPSISSNVNALTDEERLNTRRFQGHGDFNLHVLLAHVFDNLEYQKSISISQNISRVLNFKIKKVKSQNAHERFFRNQDILLSRPLKQRAVENCVNSIIDIFENVLKGKDSWRRENKESFSCEDTYAYFKQSDLQTINRDTLAKYRQLKNLLDRIIKGVKKKVSFLLVSVSFKRIIPLNLFHTYIADEDDINRVATNNFGFSNISIYQLREAVFHSINSKNLLKHEIRFGGIN